MHRDAMMDEAKGREGVAGVLPWQATQNVDVAVAPPSCLL